MYILCFSKKKDFIMQKFFAYFIWFLFAIATFYLLLFLWWLILPFLLVLFALTAFRIYQVRKTWNDLIKQSKNQAKQKSFKKVSDDNVIDVEYEEIK